MLLRLLVELSFNQGNKNAAYTIGFDWMYWAIMLIFILFLESMDIVVGRNILNACQIFDLNSRKTIYNYNLHDFTYECLQIFSFKDNYSDAWNNKCCHEWQILIMMKSMNEQQYVAYIIEQWMNKMVLIDYKNSTFKG